MNEKQINLETVARLMPAINEKALRQADDAAKLVAGYRHMFLDADAQRNVLADALRKCKASVENKALPPSARMELVRDYSTEALHRAATLNHENA